MNRCVPLALAAVCVLAASAGYASQESQRLYSLGLVEFHAGRFERALDLFDRATQADPRDPYARYYRGVTEGRLNRLDDAIADLRAALEIKPDLDQARLDLGVALEQSGDYTAAAETLARAQAAPSTEAEASLFLGIAQLRLHQIEAAQVNFQRAAEHDANLRVQSLYYQGVSDYESGNLASARERFTEVAAAGTATEIGREANAFLAKIREVQRSRYELHGAVGFEYDSNVVLATDDTSAGSSLAISNRADGRFTLATGGSAVAWRSEQSQLSVGYDFFQSLHFDLTSFNLQNHSLRAAFSSARSIVDYGIAGSYDFYLLDTDGFLHEFSALPWLTVPEGKLGRTELFYRVRRRQFIQEVYTERSALNHSLGLQQFFYLGGKADRYLLAGYRFDREDPIRADGDQFSYDGHELDLGVGWLFPQKILGQVSYEFRHEMYAPESNGRLDDESRFVVLAQKQLTDRLTLTAAYFGNINNSNTLGFDYTRHIGSLTLEMRL